MDAIASAFLAAKTVHEVAQAINSVIKLKQEKWIPVGGIDNNLAIIGLGSDPAAGVIERITNGIDAVLDRAWMEQGEPLNVFSPRSAAEEWFKIPKGRLAEIKKEDLKRFEELQGKVRVTLQDSGQDALPTVEIRDQGAGLKAEEFAESILGLNKNRKLKKLFLAGAFGQGGSTALAYSEFTIIASRAISNVGSSNKVAITVVCFERGNPEVDKHGYYRYLVDRKTGMPMTFDLSEEDFPTGTLVRHVAMQITKYKAMMTSPTGSLWYLAHNYLFDPVCPFTISDERAKSVRANKGSVLNRGVTGNNRRLTQGELTEYQNQVEQTFRDGRVTIYYWVLNDEGENPRNKITNYCLRSQPIVVTFNGQRQGDFPNTVIKGDIKLPYLDSYLVVQVDCDRLDAESRRQLFPTTRESIRDTEIGHDLRRLVQETLAGDGELKRLDKERMKKLVTNIESSSTEKIRKRLSSRIKVFTSAATGGKGPVISEEKPHTEPHYKKEPIPVHDPPSYLKIISVAPRKIYAGKKFTLQFETDARPDYFKFAESFIAVIDPPTFAQFTGTTRVNSGYGTVYFQAADDIAVGDTGKVTLELRPPRSTAIGDAIECEVIPIPDTAGTEGTGATTPNINPVWVDIEHAFWQERGWDETAVAEVEQGEDSVTVFVSGENKQFNKLLSRAQRHGEEAVEAIKNFYLEHIAFHAVIAEIDKQEAEREGILEADQAELQNKKELLHACETVCGIITSMFEVIVVESEKEANVEVN
jgi:hypothetical protein